jgi:HlyD family secretion protein
VPTQLYPVALVEDGLEAHLAHHAGGGRAIYLTVVAALIAAGVALPAVRVRIAVRSAGIIRPVTEKQAIRARISGLVERVLVAENQRVHTGDTIARFQTSVVDGRAALLAEQLARKARLAGDLDRLVHANTGTGSSAPHLETADYRREYAQLAGELRENRIAIDRATRALARVRALGAGHIATATDLEEAQATVAEARAERALIVERYRSRWQGALTTLRAEIAQLTSQRAQLDAERALYTVVAPLSGTLEQVASLSPGSYVQAGEELAVVSPSAELVAEVYVSPRDIGLLRPGTPVRVLVDAFDYRQWGVVAGSVRAVSGDFVQVDGQPMFRVVCALAARRLALPNGAVGELRKGMTLQAHFVVAKRTLLQLITDDVSDWLDPSRAPVVGEGHAP